MNNNNSGRALINAALIAVLLAPSGLLFAKDEKVPAHHRLAVGVGGGLLNFNTDAKYTNEDTGRSLYVDAEGTLGLPEYQVEPFLFGRYRFSRKHGIGFSYFQVNRSSTLLDEGFVIGGASISGEGVVTDKSRFYYVSYDHTFFEDDRSSITGVLGVHALELKYGVQAQGEITLPNQPAQQSSLDLQTDIIAPLPLVGVDFWFAYSPKWSVSAKTELVGGRYQDISAVLVNTRFAVIYGFSKHVGLTMGYSYFNAVIDIDDGSDKTDIDYGYTGVQLGLYLTFL